MLKGARLVAAMTALLLCGCVASRRGDEGDVATSLPQALEQFRADDGLLMVPQLADGTPNLPTTAFAVRLRRLADGRAVISASPAEINQLSEANSGAGVVRDAWYLSQIETATSVRMLDRGTLDQVLKAQRPDGWFVAPKPKGVQAPTARTALIDESSKAVAVLAERDTSARWRRRLRAAAESVDAGDVPAFSRWQLSTVLQETGSDDVIPGPGDAEAPAPPRRLEDEDAACRNLVAHLGLGGRISAERVREWVTWLEGKRPVGLMDLVAEALVPVSTGSDTDKIKASVLRRIEPLRLESGLYTADGDVLGDLKATYFMQTLSRLTGHPFTDGKLAAALRTYAPMEEDKTLAAWTSALRRRDIALATGVPGGDDSGGLAWPGGTDAAASRQLPTLALMAVDLGATVPRPVVPDLSALDAGPAAHAAVASWVAHSEVPPVPAATIAAWKDLVRSSWSTSYREYFNAATAVLVTEGVTEGTQWIIDDASTRLRADGGCRGVGFLVPERSGSGACDLQASTAAYLFGVAARGGEVIAEVRS